MEIFVGSVSEFILNKPQKRQVRVQSRWKLKLKALQVIGSSMPKTMPQSRSALLKLTLPQEG
ncbi:unnamed protein product [Callosobruchus maculatus]|uniref:Uncharacterized protein n=1 Tax=Callosobruchus maculatus TaxID=64391 RepID=A0A653BLW8_CALMS|nr:unnamed protein product [Callosobruchus maculatus]